MTEKVPEHLQVADELIAEGHTVSRETIPDDMAPWMANAILAIDTFSRWTGFVVAWLVLPLCFAMVYEVVARKFFVAPTMWAFDISRFLYGAMFTLGAAYALARGVHIRADFIYRNWSPRAQGRVDLVLFLLFYFPGLIVFMWMSIDYAFEAWSRGERGMDTAWMPYMGPIKSALPLGILFLLIQGVSEVLKAAYASRHNRWPF